MTTLCEIRFDLIDAGPNDRTCFDTGALADLAASIEAHGLAQPPTLRPIGDRYQIVAGERRCRAMRDVLQWETVTAIVRDLDDETASAVMLAENVQRVDLDPFDEAEGYRTRLDRFGGTQADLARHANVPASRIRGRLALLTLTDAARAFVRSGDLPLTWAGLLAELDVNRQRFALDAWISAPAMSAGAFRALTSRLATEQQADSMFDTDSFLQLEEYTQTAIDATQPVPSGSTVDLVTPVGMTEIAALLGAKVATVRVWRTRGVLPQPSTIVSGTPLWDRQTILDWAESTGRTAS